MIAGCAERFGGGALVSDAVPRWFSEHTTTGRMRTKQGYSTPPMPWGLNAGELHKIRTAHPAISDVRELPLPRRRGMYYGTLAPLLGKVPALRNVRPTMTAVARFQ
ncbi:hypothetical protein [Streptomyces sp. NPDC016845]|uniref:hypothetical protein n=1 Tax=Streptomyces sp. NPDC016845 TaxID=3364972 RepID=UPI0037B7AD84